MTAPDLVPAAMRLLQTVAAAHKVDLSGLTDRDLDLILVAVRSGIAATATYAAHLMVTPEPEPADGPPCLGTVA